jgi:uncharacterized protein (DUF433 family)
MNVIQLTPNTYQRLARRAKEIKRSPDQLVEEWLQEKLTRAHAHVEIVEKPGGPRAMIRGTRTPVSLVIGYLKLGETPEALVQEVLPYLSLAQVYDALSYYHDNLDEIERELDENTEEHGRAYLRAELGETGYRKITGQGQ